jgi:hypothetical protein
MGKLIDLVEQARVAKAAYDAQCAKVWTKGTYNGRYQPKARKLHVQLKKAEKALLVAVYR